MNEATEYAEGIEKGLKAWDILAQAWSDGVLYAPKFTEWAEAKELDGTEAAELAASDDVWVWVETEDRSPAAMWFEDALEAYGRARVRIGRTELEGVTVCLTLGGPNVWVDFEDGSDWATIRTYWGRDEDRRRVRVPFLAAAADEFAEVLTYA